jgi:hypothetical protein
MQLLDVISHSLSKPEYSKVLVDLFNVGECVDAKTLHSCFSTTEEFHQTPFVGIWKDGQFQMFRQGHRAIRELALLFHFKPDDIAESVQRFIQDRQIAFDNKPISHAS